MTGQHPFFSFLISALTINISALSLQLAYCTNSKFNFSLRAVTCECSCRARIQIWRLRTESTQSGWGRVIWRAMGCFLEREGACDITQFHILLNVPCWKLHRLFASSQLLKAELPCIQLLFILSFIFILSNIKCCCGTKLSSASHDCNGKSRKIKPGQLFSTFLPCGENTKDFSTPNSGGE